MATDDLGAPGRFTVVGLFGTTLDAEQTLIALRRASRPPEQVSVLVRSRDAAEERGEGAGAVAKAVVENALDAVGGWLLGLAALMIPNDGTYLVAGPLGAALAGMRGRQVASSQLRAGPAIDTRSAGERPREDEITQILVEFGFSPDEATYIDHRLEAGDIVVAVTTADERQLRLTRRLFAEYDAVHIGQARTREAVAHEAFALLAAPIAAVDGAEVVVTDAASPFRRLCREAEPEPWVRAICGEPVVDRDGIEVADIDDLLADALLDEDNEDRRREMRYVVMSFGGVLGLGRRRIAVPAGLVSFEPGPARLDIAGEMLQRAPEYDLDAPFSRREEQAVFAFFGGTPYWLDRAGVS